MKARRGQVHRRISATVVVLLGLIDVFQAASQHSIARVGWMSLPLGGSTTRLFRYVLLLAGLTLLSTTRGLLRGKRAAWLLAVGGTSASLVGHHVVKADALGILVAVAVFSVLGVTAGQFRAQPEPRLARQAVGWIVAGLVGAYGYGSAGLYLLDSQFRHSTTLRQSLAESVRLLFLLPVSTIEPVTHHGRWFIDSVRVLVVVVLIVGVARLLRPAAARAKQDRDLEHVRSLLEHYGDNPLAYFHLLPDKHFLFAADGEAFVGYKLVGSVAISLGGPIGSASSTLAAARIFLERCELNGWLPAFYQVMPDAARGLSSLGLKSLKIGEEAVIALDSFSLDGSHFKSIRSKTAKMKREGWTVSALIIPIDDDTMARLRTISDLWLADGGHRERTFTLGQFDEDYLRDTTVLVCRDPRGVIQGFTNLVPNYRSSDANFDLMRRNPALTLPVMDLLFVEMIERLRNEGFAGMSLGLAPLANVGGDGVVERVLRMLYERGGKAFNFVGLRTFKNKWRPGWEPRYLVYRSDAELPEVGFGVSRVGELTRADTSRLETMIGPIGATARAVFAAGRRLPLTAAVTAAMLTLQLASAIDRDAYVDLASSLRYNWSDLVSRGQFYRLFTAIFLQNGPGLRVVILAMVPLLAASEYVLRPARAALVFFAGDLCSSLLVLLLMRVAASLGSQPAMRVLVERDSGSSSAMFAALTAGALSLQNLRLRKWVIILLSLFLIGDNIVQHRLFNLQHLLAASVGAGLWWWFRYRTARRAVRASTRNTSLTAAMN